MIYRIGSLGCPSPPPMKTTLSVLACIVASTMAPASSLAADPASAPKQPQKQANKPGEWNVWVEVLMVAMPQEKAIALLPDLRSPDKVDSAVMQIFSAIERKEATITGWPAAFTLDGVRCVAEAIFEKRYPTEFSVPTDSKEKPDPKPDGDKMNINDSPPPTAFETRNTGATLEVQPSVLPGGEWIKLEMVPQRVAFAGFEPFHAGTNAGGQAITIDQPEFHTFKTSSSFVVRNNQWNLIAIHKPVQPENQIELFIARATATATK